MQFSDMQNLALYRMRQQGTNFGGSPQNSPAGFDPPYLTKLLLNQGYQEFLQRTMDYPIATLKCFFLSVANANSIALAPLPANGATPNPAAMRVYEMTYTPAGAQEYPVPLIGTPRFKRYTGSYVARFGNYGARPLFASQLFGERTLQMWPGTATAGDTIALTICPDPASSPADVPAAQGGILVADTDVPLVPAQFHMALVEYAVANLAQAANRQFEFSAAMAKFDRYVTSAQEFASAYGEGDSEMVVGDPYGPTLAVGDGAPW